MDHGAASEASDHLPGSVVGLCNDDEVRSALNQLLEVVAVHMVVGHSVDAGQAAVVVAVDPAVEQAHVVRSDQRLAPGGAGAARLLASGHDLQL